MSHFIKGQWNIKKVCLTDQFAKISFKGIIYVTSKRKQLIDTWITCTKIFIYENLKYFIIYELFGNFSPNRCLCIVFMITQFLHIWIKITFVFFMKTKVFIHESCLFSSLLKNSLSQDLSFLVRIFSHISSQENKKGTHRVPYFYEAIYPCNALKLV